jgi:hypothetical protein
MKMLNELHGRTTAIMRGFKCATRICKASVKIPLTGERARARRRLGDEGNAIVEFALILPPLMMVLTGVLSFGLALVNYNALTNGVAIGGQYLVTNRTFSTDPCGDVWSKLTAASPTLKPANITLTLTPEGGSAIVADSNGSCSGSQSKLVSGQNIMVNATYPCGFGAFGYNFASTCKLSATVTEYEF